MRLCVGYLFSTGEWGVMRCKWTEEPSTVTAAGQRLEARNSVNR
jgi:hypothetical protein